MRERFVIGRKRLVGFQGNACIDDPRLRQSRVVFFDLGEIRYPLLGAVAKVFVDTIEVQIPRSTLRKFDVPHGLERNANKKVQSLTFRLQECVDANVGRYVVSFQSPWAQR